MRQRILASFLFLFAVVLSLHALNLNKYYYQGIGKIPDKPLDYWVTLEFDDEDADFNIADLFKFMGGYKCVDKGKEMSISVEIPGSSKATLTSTDKGLSISGKVMTYEGPVQLWLLKVPRKLKKSTLSDSELEPIIASIDGYTCFAILRPQGGGKLSVTSEFSFTPGNKFKMICDSPSVQEIFKNFEGSYTITEGEIILKTDSGTVLKGNIYDDGNYLMIPVGTKNGMDLTLVLIR